MPSPSEQLSQQAFTQAKQGVVKAVSDNLRDSRAMLLAGGFISAPPEPNWDALANEAITNRTIAGVPLRNFPPVKGKPLEELIPTPQKVDSIARDVAEGVADNTGSIGMLKGATIGQAFRGFFSMISEVGFGAAISGVFNLIFGDGNSPEAKQLTQFIGRNTADAIGTGVASACAHIKPKTASAKNRSNKSAHNRKIRHGLKLACH